MRLFISLTLLWLLIGQTVAQGQTTIAIVGATLIDGTGKSPLLNGDPLIDLRNVHQIIRVIKAGVVYDPKDLMTTENK